MPIECQIAIAPAAQERFHEMDRMVMRHVFDIHNTLGRLFDERIYQDELAQRCRADGLEVHREVELRVSYLDFSKPYFLDMLAGRGAIYELKAVESLAGSHQQQLINYLLLAGINHGKLVNFRPGSVESRFVSTQLVQSARRDLRVSDGGWHGRDEASRRLREILCALLAEWGGFLELAMYREALLHFLEGPDAGFLPVEIMVGERIAGLQNMCLLDACTAWHLSGFGQQRLRAHQAHLVHLLRHTRLRRIPWINLDQQTLAFKTLTPESCHQFPLSLK